MEVFSKDGKENEKSKRGRLMNKIFKEKEKSGKDATTPLEDVDEFLYGPSDKLTMMPLANGSGNIPPLTRIDTSTARRWPAASEVVSSKRPYGHPGSKRSRMGLVVRFTEQQPDVIGEGGDEATAPVSDISIRRRAHTMPQARQPNREEGMRSRSETNPIDHEPTFPERSVDDNSFRPGLIHRTQTGFESIPDYDRSDYREPTIPQLPEPTIPQLPETQAGLGPPPKPAADRRSFAERVKDEMRSGEGQALVKGISYTSPMDEQLAGADSALINTHDLAPQMDQLQINTFQNQHIPAPSPARRDVSHPHAPGLPEVNSLRSKSSSEYSAQSPTSTLNIPSGFQHSQDLYESTNRSRSPASFRAGIYGANHITENPAVLSRTNTISLSEPAVAVGDDALGEFSARTAHLLTLFRLSTEAFRPISQCSLEEVVRAALWWFLKGRLGIENTIRERPSSPQAQQSNFFLRQQAYADLAKALWLTESVATQFPEVQYRSGSTDSATPLNDVLETRRNILSSLKKLTISMKRNNFLPPEVDDAPLTQGLDASIWVQDEGNRSLITSQSSLATLSLSEALPLGDTNKTFQFARMFVDAMLVEDAASQYYRCPALVTLVRGHKERGLTAVTTTQDGSLNMTIQTDKNRGPTWRDARWQAKSNTLELNMPRGFVLRLVCSEQNFRTLWGLYDYEQRTQDILERREGEQLVYEIVLRNFQYFDQNSQPSFPKEPQPSCILRVFEQTIVQKAATGPRTLHRGFRFALNTSTKTKNLRGVDQEFSPKMPILFGMLRGEDGSPALLLKIDDMKAKYTMVTTFDNVADRARLHSLVSGQALRASENMIAEAALKEFSISNTEGGDLQCFHALDSYKYNFVNQDDHGDLQSNKTVLSEQLRVIIHSKAGTFTDRLNVEPGELKMRLSINGSNTLKVLRQPQQDATLTISESQVPRDVQRELAGALEVLAKAETIRTYTFPSIMELHLFQAAMTGFVVLFDTVASSFNISRRRMVVPIYKKWDAASTRLQIVQKEKVIQLVAFFENFSHGDCMNFTLKSTDIFEASSRSGKHSLRIVDAKFAMPKAREGEKSVDHEYVCLDMPEYPGEHDDITIYFDSEAILNEFTKALPAPSKIASRLGSVRR